MKILTLAVLAAAVLAHAAKPALMRVAGKVAKSSVKMTSGKKGPVFTEGRLTIIDEAGHTEEYRVDARTKVTCDGKRAAFAQSAVPGACDRVTRLLYDAGKRVHLLELKTALKADADDARGRPAVTGEVASTDVLAGKLSVRMGGGNMLDFTVGDATKIAREAKDKPAESIPFEAVKVGDRVEVHSKDWKTADEIHVRAPAP